MAITFHAGSLTFVLPQAELARVEQACSGRATAFRELPVDPYETTVFGSRAEIEAFTDRLEELRRGYRVARVAELVRERRVRAPTPELIEQAVAPLLARDTVLSVLDRLLAFVRGALRAGAAEMTVVGD